LQVQRLKAVSELRVGVRVQVPEAVERKLTEACPAGADTSLRLTLAKIHRATPVCRRSWLRIPVNPAARTASAGPANRQTGVAGRA
jgi:hypothetical protein